jgi:ribulose-bisphosphate carboxylase large chain
MPLFQQRDRTPTGARRLVQGMLGETANILPNQSSWRAHTSSMRCVCGAPGANHSEVKLPRESTMSQTQIIATYRVKATLAQAQSLAVAIAYEQTVELPVALVTDPHVNEHVVGEVLDVAADGAQHCLVRIGYASDLGALHLSQLLNLLYGNVSIYGNVRLMDVHLPQAVVATFHGPNYGLPGVRELLGVYGRPLLATALKPNGLAFSQLAQMAHDFALGGGDIVKDDQNLISDFEAFKDRTALCAEALARAEQRTGRRCLYLPHVLAPGPDLRQYFDYIKALGLTGVLICPLIVGLDTTRVLAREYNLLVMAHPSMSGSYTCQSDGGIDHGVLLGTLFRLAGADISVFPHAGGRFTFSSDACTRIASALRQPLGAMQPTWAAPAGGMQFENVSELGAHYGADTVLLIGGALLGHDASLTHATQAFQARIAERYTQSTSATPPPLEKPAARPLGERHFAFVPDYEWRSRPSSPYKDAADSSFKAVRRVELVGKYGERTHADLRYFEIEPGGFSSMEQHLHTHIVIGARGEGVLQLGNERVKLAVNDVAYIEPMEVHQLRNETDMRFGFYCIVDHDRDRPRRL